MSLMCNLDRAPAPNPGRIANWGWITLGAVCLGISLWSATGAIVDLDYRDVYQLDRWATSVIIEIGVAAILMVFGPWCLLHGIRSRRRHH